MKKKAFNREEMIEVLKQVSLGHLQDRLDQEQDWTRILSLGEQQRLAFARLLLHKPNVAFLDEATASMDEGLEDNMYRLLKRMFYLIQRLLAWGIVQLYKLSISNN